MAMGIHIMVTEVCITTIMVVITLVIMVIILEAIMEAIMAAIMVIIMVEAITEVIICIMKEKPLFRMAEEKHQAICHPGGIAMLLLPALQEGILPFHPHREELTELAEEPLPAHQETRQQQLTVEEQFHLM